MQSLSFQHFLVTSLFAEDAELIEIRRAWYLQLDR